MALEHDSWIKEVFGLDMTGAPGPAGADAAAGGGAGAGHGQGPPSHKAVKLVPRAGIGPAQTKRAHALLQKMAPAEQEQVSDLLARSKGAEHAYLTKALASGHRAAELEAFQAKIAGKDHAWMENNLHLVGKSSGKGIKQQWQSSCVPTTVEAMRGELDPIYALRMNEANPALTEADDHNATRLSPGVAADQKGRLLHGGGVPTNRDTAGVGMQFEQILADQAGTTGLAFTPRYVGKKQEGGQTIGQVLDEIDASLSGGMPVPMHINDGGANGGHAVLCTGFDKGPPRRYSIHDPWDGITVIVTEKEIRDDKFKIAGWHHLAHIYQPSAIK